MITKCWTLGDTREACTSMQRPADLAITRAPCTKNLGLLIEKKGSSYKEPGAKNLYSLF